MQDKKEKKVIIFTLCIIFLITIVRIFLAPVIAGDEFVNYYNTFKIFSGDNMWEEVNIITTPFIYILGCLFFRVLGTKLIVYRLLNLLINVIFFGIIYITFRSLEINKKSSLIYAAILEIPTISYVSLWGVTYNIVATLFCLIGLNLNLKKNTIKRYNLCQGLIIFLIIFTKHNIGIYYVIAQILIELIIEKKWKKITNLTKQGLVVLIGLTIFFYTIYKAELLYAFIDMAILGISQFATNIYIDKIPCFVTIGVLVLTGILIYKKKYNLNDKEKVIILSITGIMMLFMIYPVASDWHVILGSMILYVELIYLLDMNGIKLTSNNVLIGISLYFILYIILNMSFVVYSINNDTIRFDLNNESKFYLSAIKEPDKVDKINEFIKVNNGKVLVVSPEAGIFNIYSKLEGRGFFDEPFNGNLGTNQLDKMIKKLDEYNDFYILVHNNKKYTQEILDFKIYIDENFNKVGEIGDYYIYK